jgi:hypothetical protein
LYAHMNNKKIKISKKKKKKTEIEIVNFFKLTCRDNPIPMKNLVVI